MTVIGHTTMHLSKIAGSHTRVSCTAYKKKKKTYSDIKQTTVARACDRHDYKRTLEKKFFGNIDVAYLDCGTA